MVLNERIDAKFQEILEEGKKMLAIHPISNGMGGFKSDRGLEYNYNKLFVSALNLIEKTCGKDSSYYVKLEDLYTKYQTRTYHIPKFVGIIESAYEDLKLGLLEDTRALITAEVFVDFMEQAEYLLSNGYKLPAAVLARAVLEDSLRILCKENGIALSGRPKLDKMNADLTKKNVYNRNVQKQVTAWSGIGNSAAHGRPNEFSDSDVRNMINGIVTFNATYLK